MTQKKMTYTDYCQRNDERRYEIIDGTIYMLAASNTVHQRIVTELTLVFGNHLRGKSCNVFPAPFDVRLPMSEENDQTTTNVVQPDLTVLCDKSKLKLSGCVGAPDLIVEIISPNSWRRDWIAKKALYQRAGVREYLVVDPYTTTISQFVLDAQNGEFAAEVLLGIEDQLTSAVLPDLTVPLGEIFTDEVQEVLLMDKMG